MIGARTVPAAYIVAPKPEWVSGTEVRMNGFCTASFNLNNYPGVFEGNTLVVTSSSGLNGLLPGATAAAGDTLHMFALIKAGGDLGGYGWHNSTASGAITLSGSTYYRVRLPLSVVLDGAGNIFPFVVHEWASRSATINHAARFDYLTPASNPTMFANAISPTTYTAYSVADFVPEGATAVRVHSASGGSSVFRIRAFDGLTIEGHRLNTGGIVFDWMPLDAGLDVDVLWDSILGASPITLSVKSYKVAV
jgi:hypothetical protein